MVRGPLPNVAVLGPSKLQRVELVQLQAVSTAVR
jgi:amino-acid N-acetyltransferase